MQRSRPIDLLRAVAVFLVLGRHMHPCPMEFSPILHSITTIWARGGWIGVDLFFVLSGFLVSGLLFREYEKYGCISGTHFLIRRGFKIYPGFWLLAGAGIALGILRHSPPAPHRVVSELLFVQNYFPSLWGHTWSLAVEEHFYLLLVAFFLWISSRRSSPNPFSSIPAVFALLALVCLALRMLTALKFPDGYHDQVKQLFPTHLRIDSLFFGVLISFFYHQHQQQFLARIKRLRLFLFVTGILCLTPAFIFPLESTPLIRTWGLTLFYLGSGSLLCATMATGLPDYRAFRWIAYIGSHSYSIYLWHIPVHVSPLRKLGPDYSITSNWLYYFAAYFLASIGFGILMSLAVELPMLRIRDKWFPSRSRALLSSEVQEIPGHSAPLIEGVPAKDAVQ
jgi:peptidoglycan/LPS O-acetylase OafA/YrhL